MKWLLLCLIILISPFYSHGLREFSVPLTTDYEEQIVLQNSSNERIEIWLSSPSEQNDPDFTPYFVLQPFEKLILPEFTQLNWLKVWTSSQSVSVSLALNQSNQMVVTEETSSLLSIGPQLFDGEVWLSNLSANPQRVEFVDQKTKTVDFSIDLSSQQTKKILWPRNLKKYSIQGQYRLSGFFYNPTINKISALTASKSKPQPATGNYFVLENPDKTQSFIVQISDPHLLELAYKQILEPLKPQPRILIARISAGNQGYNFDTHSDYQAPWSWSVSQIHRFADFASTECNGNPQYLEQYLLPWIEQKQGLICFWGYRITREIKF
jgi:hypothetical protein